MWPLKFKSKTEAEFALNLSLLLAAGEIQWWEYEPWSLKLGEGARYTPDFITMNPDGTLHVWEVKGGFAREAAMVRLRAAATKYWMIPITLAIKKEGKWTHSPVPNGREKT